MTCPRFYSILTALFVCLFGIAPPPIPMETTTTTTTTAAPDSVDEQTVEGSENNTRTLKGMISSSAFIKYCHVE